MSFVTASAVIAATIGIAIVASIFMLATIVIAIAANNIYKVITIATTTSTISIIITCIMHVL